MLNSTPLFVQVVQIGDSCSLCFVLLCADLSCCIEYKRTNALVYTYVNSQFRKTMAFRSLVFLIMSTASPTGRADRAHLPQLRPPFPLRKPDADGKAAQPPHPDYTHRTLSNKQKKEKIYFSLSLHPEKNSSIRAVGTVVNSPGVFHGFHSGRAALFRLLLRPPQRPVRRTLPDFSPHFPPRSARPVGLAVLPDLLSGGVV